MIQEDTDNIEVEIQDDEPIEGVETPIEEQTTDDELAQAKAEAAKYRRLFEKSQKPNQPVVEKKSETPSSPLVDIDERVLKAQGMSDELLGELKVIAKVRGVSLIDAQNDHLFVASKEKFEKDAKSKTASLSASRGSGHTKPKKDLMTPGLTREEHMEMAKSI